MAESMNWWEYGKLHPKSYLTDQEHTILVKKESIPIVFVPGIMGSRLKRDGKSVWNPNDGYATYKTYHSATPEERQKLLGSPGLEVDEDTSNEFQQSVSGDTFKRESGGFFGMMGFGSLPPSMQKEVFDKAAAMGQDAAAQGWGGVAWSFYGDFLLALSAQGWKPFDKVFVHPVYAVAYNWTQDNAISGAYLAGKIAQVKAREQGKGRSCEKVIVVSHSMGGLVARAAAKLSGAEGDVFGMIHGAQPVLGAPAAYRRMRAGFEKTSWPSLSNVQSDILGSTSQNVMAVLSHSIGGLELLPNQLYRTGYGYTQWLKRTRDGILLEELPAGDPYASIYKDQTSFLRLAYHPEYIDPASAKIPATARFNPVKKALGDLGQNLDAAKAFHTKLALQCHAVTYSSWVGKDGLGTWDKIEYRYLRDRAEPYTVYSPEGMPIYIEPNPNEGTGTDYSTGEKGRNASGYYSIQPQDAKGDGTVPESSGAALKAQSRGVGKKLSSKIVTSVEHSAFYNNGQVRQFTSDCVMELTQKQFNDRMGL